MSARPHSSPYAELPLVRVYEDGPVEIRIGRNGRYQVVAYNGGGADYTSIDLYDLLDALKIDTQRVAMPPQNIWTNTLASDL
jgi:hypothetical protein